MPPDGIIAPVLADSLDISPQWQDLDMEEISGRLLVIGASDTGKSTFSRYLFERLVNGRGSIGYLDGDPGQSRLGPPSTMTLVCSDPGDKSFPPSGKKWRRFVGSTTPVGHMLQVLVGAARSPSHGSLQA